MLKVVQGERRRHIQFSIQSRHNDKLKNDFYLREADYNYLIVAIKWLLEQYFNFEAYKKSSN